MVIIETSLKPYHGKVNLTQYVRGRRGRERMIVGFITTYAVNVYHH